MFPGSQQYPDNAFPPERGLDHNWHVWCQAGALQILDSQEYADFLKANPQRRYSINFANGSAARIWPEHALWKALAKIAKVYKVQVYPLDFSQKWVDWSGEPSSLRAFDCLTISLKEANDNHKPSP